MAESFSSGLTSITGNVSVSTTSAIVTPSATQTIVRAFAAGTGALQTIYTVTAGKTAYLFACQWSGTAADSPVVYLSDGSTIVAAAKIAANSTHSFQPAIPIAAYAGGTAVKCFAAATSTTLLILIEQ